MFTLQVGAGVGNANNLSEVTTEQLVGILGNCAARLAHRGPMNLEWPTSADEIPPTFDFGDYVGDGEPGYNDFVDITGLNVNDFSQNATLVVSNPASEPGPDPQGGQYPTSPGGFSTVIWGTAYIKEIYTDRIWYSGTQGGTYSGTPNMCWDEIEVPTNLSYDPVACTMSWETKTIRVMVPCASTGGADPTVTQPQGPDNPGGGSLYPILLLQSAANAASNYYYN